MLSSSLVALLLMTSPNPSKPSPQTAPAAAPAASSPSAHPTPTSFFELRTRSLDGKPVDLSQYAGKVVLVVNTASRCGHTPQYAGLEKLYQDHKQSGLVVLGFPSNDFGGQEPGSAAQIKKFCELNYKVSFPMMEKVKTKGAETAAVYQFLGSKHGAPQWNFHKYLVGRDGQVHKAFDSSVEPDSDELLAELKTLLAKG